MTNEEMIIRMNVSIIQNRAYIAAMQAVLEKCGITAVGEIEKIANEYIGQAITKDELEEADKMVGYIKDAYQNPVKYLYKSCGLDYE